MTRYESLAWNSADPATRARVRGRRITAALAHLATANPVAMVRVAAGDRAAWETFVDPAGGYKEPIGKAAAR